MTEIVGIQFQNNSRLYYFSPGEEKFENGEYAIVETVRGMELGKVIVANRIVEDNEILYELKPVVRKANKEDLLRDEKNKELAPVAFDFFKAEVSKLGLEMKPLYCEYTIDGQKLLFYYTADDRVDFRNLVKNLAQEFKTRIELRQIGPREAARIVGGLGPCGRTICCKSCLNNFDYVTMKMAKEQDMSLNISKISGICGKLLCCIGYEHEMYCKIKSEMPKPGEIVKTPKASSAKVVSIDVQKHQVCVLENVDGAEVQNKYKENEIIRFVLKDPKVDEGVIKVENVEVETESKEISTETESIEQKTVKLAKKKFHKKPKTKKE